MDGERLATLQAAVREAEVNGWLFYDFRRSNPIAHRILELPEYGLFTRRWFYYLPAEGEPVAITSAVEAHVLDSLPGRHVVYRSWRELHALLSETLAGAARVAMEYTPLNDNPYVSRVDAGTVELVRSQGAEVVPSADFAQRFEAVLTPAQIASHRRAGQALLRARDGALAWLRERLLAGDALTEYDMQQEFSRRMRAEGLSVPPDDEPLVAVNANAANPHYMPQATSAAPLARGDLLLLDFSARSPDPDGVFADYTWMVYLGERVPDRVAQFFAIIAEARDEGIALLRARFEAGERIAGYQVDDAVRGIIAAAGYGDAFLHRTGHNIGAALHGNGAHLDNLETHDTRPLLANTCVSVEPGVYLPAEGLGLRTEVDVLLLPGGIEVTGTPAQEAVTALLA